METKPYPVEQLRGESPIPADVIPNPVWGKQFGHEFGIVFRFKNGRKASLFLDSRLSSKDPQEVLQILETESTAGYVINCESQEWVIKTEPTFDGQFGVIVYTKSGKAYISGIGEVKKTGEWTVTFSTLYPGIRNTKKCHAQGGVHGGTGQRTEAQAGVGCDF
jgi:hypothetical protein